MNQQMYDAVKRIVGDTTKTDLVAELFNRYIRSLGYCPTHLVALQPNGTDEFGELRRLTCPKCCEGSEDDIPF